MELKEAGQVVPNDVVRLSFSFPTLPLLEKDGEARLEQLHDTEIIITTNT